MKPRKGSIYIGSFCLFLDNDIAFCSKVLSLLSLFFSFLCFSQIDSIRLGSVKTTESTVINNNEVYITNASELHVVGDAFVYHDDKLLVATGDAKKQKVDREELAGREFSAQAKKNKFASKKVVVPKLKDVVVHFNSNATNSHFILSTTMMAKSAVSTTVDVASKGLNFFLSVNKNLELLYQKKVYFYSSHVGQFNFSEAFSVRPPPFI